MQSPRAAIAAGTATFALLAGVIGLGARVGAFGFGGSAARSDALAPAAAAPAQSSDVVPAPSDPTTSVQPLSPSRHEDREHAGRTLHDGGRDEHDDDD